MPQQTSDDLDNTDELPVLLETVVLAEADPHPPLPVNDVDDATALHAAPRASFPAPPASAEQSVGQFAARSRFDGETTRLRELEQALAEKERVVEQLERTIMERRRAEDAGDELDAKAAELAERDARVTELTARLDALSVELETRTARISELEATIAEARNVPATVDPSPAPPPASPALEEALEANATLAAYIDGRREWWDRAEAERNALAERVMALERDLAASASQAEQAEAFAERETARAAELRAELVETARRLDAAERAQREQRTSESARDTELSPANARQPDTVSVPATANAPTPPPGSAADTPPISEAAIEVIAQLEAEVEHKRQQVAAQMLELRDREQRLATSAADLERTRGEISNLRGDLDKAREHIVRLEHTIIDKDRALDARDTRITTLQEELKQRLGARKRDAIDLSLQGLELRMTERAREHGVDGTQGPALVCLTGDAEKRFALTKQTIVVGRGAHCDLQILTHFVSREHARISLSGEEVLIEDLGSRNGVFVNSVRIDRQMLEHGDLVTIGETQFRFVESMAH